MYFVYCYFVFETIYLDVVQFIYFINKTMRNKGEMNLFVQRSIWILWSPRTIWWSWTKKKG